MGRCDDFSNKITAAIEPKPASKENHEQHDDQNQFHGLSLISFVGNPCRAGWQLSTGPIEPAVERRPSERYREVYYTSDYKHRLAQRG